MEKQIRMFKGDKFEFIRDDVDDTIWMVAPSGNIVDIQTISAISFRSDIDGYTIVVDVWGDSVYLTVGDKIESKEKAERMIREVLDMMIEIRALFQTPVPLRDPNVYDPSAVSAEI